MHTHTKKSGFTIVELLIVIVIIGILAAITIVAYSGISQRATVASLSVDLENAAKQLKLDQVDLSSYPATTSAANGGVGLKASAGTTYQYSVNNSASPQTFCLTASKNSISYYINENGTPISGACSGHIAGGATIITNLVDNPSLEGGSTNWSVSNVSNLSSTRTTINGKAVFQASRLTTSAAAVRISFGGLPVTIGQPYTASTLVTSSVNQTVRMEIRTPPGTTALAGGSTAYTLTANVPQRIWAQGVPTASTVYLAVVFDTAGAVGDTLTIDEAMLTQGSTVYNYADGSSPGWSWNGTPNLSASTGPAL